MPIVQEAPKPNLGENPASDPRGIGDNRPPVEEQIAMEFREALLGERPDFMVRMTGAIEAVIRRKSAWVTTPVSSLSPACCSNAARVSRC